MVETLDRIVDVVSVVENCIDVVSTLEETISVVTAVHEMNALVTTLHQDLLLPLPSFIERESMTEEEKIQNDEWQLQLKQQEDEEKNRRKLKKLKEMRLQEDGWTSMGIVNVVPKGTAVPYGMRRNGTTITLKGLLPNQFQRFMVRLKLKIEM